MLRVRLLPFLLTAAMSSMAMSAFSWSATGHMVVTNIAWRNMSDKARAEAKRLVDIDAPEKSPDFITAGVWADDTRTRENGPWHYIDFYFRADGKSTDLKPDAENVVWAIEKFTKVLEDHSSPDAERAKALRYLLHFVGDIHQPLHCTARVTDDQPKGDAGGNKFIADDPAGTDGRRPRNLHSLWDSGCGFFAETRRPLTKDGTMKLDSLAEACLAELTDGEKSEAHSVADPMAWAKDGSRLAMEVVYKTPVNTVPSAEYIQAGQKLSRKQVAIAGLRLADLLNRLLG